MDKILFYVNDYEEAKLVFPHVEKLYREGWEVAFDAPSWEVIELLALTRVLVVKHTVYHPDVFVTNSKHVVSPPEADRRTLPQFLEVLA